MAALRKPPKGQKIFKQRAEPGGSNDAGSRAVLGGHPVSMLARERGTPE